jgi:DnaJ-class molecular chaperone
MAQTIEIKRKCAQCGGTGTHTNHEADGTPYEGPCQWPGCNGDGWYVVERIVIDPGLDDLKDKLDDIKEKVDEIKDVVDAL